MIITIVDNHRLKRTIFLWRTVKNRSKMIAIGHWICNRKSSVDNSLYPLQVFWNQFWSLRDSLEFRTKLRILSLIVRMEEIVDFSHNCHNWVQWRKNRIRQRRKKGCEQGWILLLLIWKERIHCSTHTIFLSQKPRRNLRTDNESLKFVSSNHSFNLLLPGERIGFIKFETNSMRKRNWWRRNTLIVAATKGFETEAMEEDWKLALIPY